MFRKTTFGRSPTTSTMHIKFVSDGVSVGSCSLGSAFSYFTSATSFLFFGLLSLCINFLHIFRRCRVCADRLPSVRHPRRINCVRNTQITTFSFVWPRLNYIPTGTGCFATAKNSPFFCYEYTLMLPSSGTARCISTRYSHIQCHYFHKDNKFRDEQGWVSMTGRGRQGEKQREGGREVKRAWLYEIVKRKNETKAVLRGKTTEDVRTTKYKYFSSIVILVINVRNENSTSYRRWPDGQRAVMRHEKIILVIVLQDIHTTQ